MASNAVLENGPAARNFAVDAHNCIMVQVPQGPAEYKCVGALLARRRRVPLGLSDHSAILSKILMMVRPFGIPLRDGIQAGSRSRLPPRRLARPGPRRAHGGPQPLAGWTEDADASRRALTRARFAADGLDPSASSVHWAHQSVGAKRRREEKEFTTEIALDNGYPHTSLPRT